MEKESDSEKDVQPEHNKARWKCRDIFKASNFIISMNSTWKTVFDTFVLLVVAYSIFTSLFYVAFDPKTPELMDVLDDYAFYIFVLDFVLSKFLFSKLLPLFIFV